MVKVPYKFVHPKGDELYTPFTPEVQALLAQMYLEFKTWRLVSYHSGIRLKILRNIRGGRYKAISLRTMDRLITGTGVGDLRDYTFFTADDLVALGIWKSPLYVAGSRRFKKRSGGVPVDPWPEPPPPKPPKKKQRRRRRRQPDRWWRRGEWY